LTLGSSRDPKAQQISVSHGVKRSQSTETPVLAAVPCAGEGRTLQLPERAGWPLPCPRRVQSGRRSPPAQPGRWFFGAATRSFPTSPGGWRARAPHPTAPAHASPSQAL